MDISQILLKILDVILLGAISSARQKRKTRAEMIFCAKNYIESKQFGVQQFMRKRYYAELNPYLGFFLKRRMNRYGDFKSSEKAVAEREEIRQKLFNVVSKLERKWNLI